MKLEQSFDVNAPLERVWEALIDVERVAPCLPGAEITDVGEDGTYRGTFSVRLGPTKAAYDGELSLESVDDDAHRVTMSANGRDKRGQGSAKATIQSVLREQGAGTRVDVETDFTITGKLARFGRGGMIQDVSNRLMKDFSTCLAETIEAGGEPEPVPQPEPPAASSVAAASAPRPAAPSHPAPKPAKPVKGLSLILSVMWERLRRLIARLRG